ncbi:MAG: CHRD domain-containing protein [Rhodospirillales bacterium]|nr:MAG: CHRD domain-containing protein [Rhodospirillales bacterium]
MIRRTFIHVGLSGIALGALATTGCQTTREAPSRRTEFRARLGGASEVPANRSQGKGEMEATYDPASKELAWRLHYADLSGPATGAHFHGPAAAGANAGVVVPITGSVVGTWHRGEARLTDAQAADLMAGRWYVNVHTARFPGGEIRGQVLPDGR